MLPVCVSRLVRRENVADGTLTRRHFDVNASPALFLPPFASFAFCSRLLSFLNVPRSCMPVVSAPLQHLLIVASSDRGASEDARSRKALSGIPAAL